MTVNCGSETIPRAKMIYTTVLNLPEENDGHVASHCLLMQEAEPPSLCDLTGRCKGTNPRISNFGGKFGFMYEQVVPVLHD